MDTLYLLLSGLLTSTLGQWGRKLLLVSVFFSVLLKATRNSMRNWSISAGNRGWGTKLDVRDLGGHLDITNRARAGSLAH